MGKLLGESNCSFDARLFFEIACQNQTLHIYESVQVKHLSRIHEDQSMIDLPNSKIFWP